MWINWVVDDLFYFFSVCFLVIAQADGSHYHHEGQLHKDLFELYRREIRPADEAGNPLLVHVYPTLVRINGVHENDGMLEATISLSMSWVDSRLKWHPQDYGGITQTHVALENLWKPDVSPSNGVSDSSRSAMAALSSTGTVAAVILQTSRSYCNLDLRHFPFDTQSCDILFSSWIYSYSQLAMEFWSGSKYSSDVSVSDIVTTDSREWSVGEENVRASIHNITHSCCPDDPFVQLKISVQLVRQATTMSHVLVCQLAVFLLLIPLQFCLPASSNERAMFGVFVLVGSFLLLQSMLLCVPPIQTPTPKIGQLYLANICLSLVALVLSTLVTWVLYQQSTNRPMSKTLRQILHGLNPIFCKYEFRGKQNGHNGLVKGNMSDDEPAELDTFTEIHEQTGVNGSKPQSEKLQENSIDIYKATSSLEAILKHTNRLLKELSRVLQDKDSPSSGRLNGEWINLAEVLDRLFFIIFAVTSVIILILLLTI